MENDKYQPFAACAQLSGNTVQQTEVYQISYALPCRSSSFFPAYRPFLSGWPTKSVGRKKDRWIPIPPASFLQMSMSNYGGSSEFHATVVALVFLFHPTVFMRISDDEVTYLWLKASDRYDTIIRIYCHMLYIPFCMTQWRVVHDYIRLRFFCR